MRENTNSSSTVLFLVPKNGTVSHGQSLTQQELLEELSIREIVYYSKVFVKFIKEYSSSLVLPMKPKGKEQNAGARSENLGDPKGDAS